MAPYGHWLVVYRIGTRLAFTLARLVLGIVQSIIWRLNGVQQAREAARKPENYNRCVHVMDIVKSHKFDGLEKHTMSDFIVKHNRFESPDYIFQQDNVTLMMMDDDYAYFGESHPKEHLWQTEWAFMRQAQVDRCIRMLAVPRAAFHRMAEQLGDPKQKITFVFNTSRCGSTLLTQILEASGDCVAISEPDVPIYLCENHRDGKSNSEELQRDLRDAVRWICRPYSFVKPSVYMVKLTSTCVINLDHYQNLFPTSKYLFMYRNCESVAKSLHRMANALPFVRAIWTLSKYSAYITEKAVDITGYSGKDLRVKTIDEIDFGVNVWIVTAKAYVDLRRKGFPISAVRYEDVVGNSKYACREILKFCGLPESLTDKAVKGLELDSQRNCIISTAILKQFTEPPMTEGAKIRGNALCKKFGLPLIGEPCLLEGTITCQQT